MPIGSPALFTKEHIERVRRDASPVLAEQVVHCLELVAQLVSNGLRFMFKGGNSLLLLLDAPRRFSIDIDIASDETRERIDEAVTAICASSGVFHRFEKRQHKTKPWLPMVSYNLFYRSHFTDPAETFIMLDVQLRLSGYAKAPRPVKCLDIYEAPVECLLPTEGSLIGDKLLTLGPATLGIPVGKGKDAQRLKHVFDIATLADRRPALEAVRGAIDYCMKQENELQQKSLTFEETLADTLDFLAGTARFAAEPSPEGLPPRPAEIVTGRVPFAEHLLARDYPWPRLQRDLAKVAYVFCAVAAGTADAAFHETLATPGADAAFFWRAAEAALGRKILA